jgi:hypothetical protein
VSSQGASPALQQPVVITTPQADARTGSESVLEEIRITKHVTITSVMHPACYARGTRVLSRGKSGRSVKLITSSARFRISGAVPSPPPPHDAVMAWTGRKLYIYLLMLLSFFALFFPIQSFYCIFYIRVAVVVCSFLMKYSKDTFNRLVSDLFRMLFCVCIG